HFSGRSSAAKIAETGQTGTQAPQSIHSTGSMNSMLLSACGASSFLGWMQSTGQASTQAVSFVPMQGSAITYAIEFLQISAPRMYLAGRDEFCRKTRILSFNFHKGDGESRRKAKLNTEYMKVK